MKGGLPSSDMGVCTVGGSLADFVLHGHILRQSKTAGILEEKK